jgi:peptidoglycan hydrolase FlgJ
MSMLTTPSVSGRTSSASTDPRDAALRQAADELQGVFVQEMLKVMRTTVPADGGLTERSQGEEIFTSLMDERVAAETSSQWSRGLGDAIHRALRQAAHLDAPTSAPSLVEPPRA